MKRSDWIGLTLTVAAGLAVIITIISGIVERCYPGDDILTGDTNEVRELVLEVDKDGDKIADEIQRHPVVELIEEWVDCGPYHDKVRSVYRVVYYVVITEDSSKFEKN
jgi:hypothetical protein